VKKAGRIALLLSGAVLALLAVAVLGVNLYVQSHGTQERIEQELSQRLGTTLRIQRISVTPWWGLKLTGITMPQSDRGVSADFLNAETFRLRVRFASLFSGRLVIKEISLIRPKVVWAQDADGKWRLPSYVPIAERGAVDERAGSVAPLEAPPAATRSGAPGVAASEPAPATGNAGPFTPEVRRVNLARGDFRFLDRQGKPVATFEGVGFRSNLRNAVEIRGTASIAKVSLRNRFFLEDLKSPVKYDPSELDFSQIKARAAGGEITGRFSMNPADADSPFQVRVGFRDLQADRILEDAGGPAGMLQGRLEGSLEARGKTADPNALSGAGEIFLRDGQVRRYSLLIALGQLLQIDELSELRLDQAQVKYHITPGMVMIDELLLTSPNIRLSATGTVSFAGKLRLESRLAINERIHGQLFRAVRENFHPIDQPGYAAVDFQVTGTIERPKTNLMGKLIGPELKDLSGLLNDFLGGGKTERPAKKRTPRTETAPVPMSEPPPPELIPPTPPAGDAPSPASLP